jgi:hypothetical protein
MRSLVSIPLNSLENESHLSDALKFISFFTANKTIVHYKSVIQNRLGKYPLLTVRTTEKHKYVTV